MIIPSLEFTKVLVNNYIFKFANKCDNGKIFLLAILDLSDCGVVVYSGYYKYEFDEFFVDDEHKRRFVTFVEALSSSDTFLKAKLGRACEDAVLYLQNQKVK